MHYNIIHLYKHIDLMKILLHTYTRYRCTVWYGLTDQFSTKKIEMTQ